MKTSSESIDYEYEDNKLFNKHCKTHKYYPLIMPAKKTIIAIGDLHGDYDLAIRILKLANMIDVINNDVKWIGKDTFVVQIGDQLDNCRPNDQKCDVPTNDNFDELPEDIKVLNLFNDLNLQAEKENGAVISLIGNHEIMNAEGYVNYVSYKDIMRFKKNGSYEEAKQERINAFKPGSKYAKLMACTRLPAIIIGSFIFVHAGFISTFMDKYKIKNRNDLYKVSYSLRKWLLGTMDVKDIVGSWSYSMFWNRILGSIPANMSNNDERCVNHVEKALDIFRVKGMVIGHTPQFHENHSGINKTCGDKLWRIDFGGSYCFDKFDEEFIKNGHSVDLRNAQALKITNDEKITIIK